MFAIGLALSGRLFPFDSASRSWRCRPWPTWESACRVVASAIGAGAGNVRAVTYEAGNAYIIVAGLLNLLVVIDVYDVALGRK